MTRSEKILAILTFILIVLAFLPVSSSGQWQEDDYYRNQRDYNQGRILSVIKRLENRSSEFERRLDREFEKKRNNWTRKENYLLSLARDFERATDRLEDIYSSSRSLSRSYYQAQRVLALGRQIDNEIYHFAVSKNVLKDWERIRKDLNELSNIYAYRDDRDRKDRKERRYEDYDEKRRYPDYDNNFPNRRHGSRNPF
ncbi:MAG: hypothetical protein N2Z23_04140 [Pyrinomonadaceae bacterium]|nr:hypothetical protein [Pyrinomonadaceae bacterium]MCX7639613.1 hypothetical protein [Pyrinomonadaceae bacterium]MDW8303369.1 hypothetical protein [Acidobacteriota bacterium]